jgi:beta-galactosidase
MHRIGSEDSLLLPCVSSGRFLLFLLCLFGYSGFCFSTQCQEHSAPLASTQMLHEGGSVREISLDGQWDAGIDRHYDRTLRVPGLASDPGKPTAGTLWYKRTIQIPAGRWTRATLILKGARFAPQVYMNGVLVSSAQGGMAPTLHEFALPAQNGNKPLTIEIALASLTNLDPLDASAVPVPDLWRSNVSSYLWDSVILRLHGDEEIRRVTPFPVSEPGGKPDDRISLHWELAGASLAEPGIRFTLFDEAGHAVASATIATVLDQKGETFLALGHRVAPWSPEHPHLYRLRTELFSRGHLADARDQSFGLRSFTMRGLGFTLNGEPYHLRMGTVVWHRWTRDPEARKIAFDPSWFERNVVLRLKSEGANALRFHLGLPPETFLDLCDRDGLTVQMEWPFFHGVAASGASMAVQWREWLDVAMRHPSVVIVQAWNETGEAQLTAARPALSALLRQYPPLVADHIDVTPVHKYWWSLFENLGLYYDSASQLGTPVMVDEFGGDYLDAAGNPGGYPTTSATFLRFLGYGNTKQERLQLEDEANGRVAEYWRRLGVAGFAPFCIVSSPEDGNNWFLGPEDMGSPTPKPVWTALSAAWAQQSVSLELWNRNFAPGETIHTPLWFFNESAHANKLRVTIHVVDATSGSDVTLPFAVSEQMPARGTRTMALRVPLPKSVGEWRIEARLETPPAQDARYKVPVVSYWRIRTFVPTVPPGLRSIGVDVPENEAELRAMLVQMHVKVVSPNNPAARVVLGSRATWQALATDAAIRGRFAAALHRGASIVLLDAGPEPLGAGYASGAAHGGPLEGAPTVHDPQTLQTAQLFGGVTAEFREASEPESTVQQPLEDGALWWHVPHEATWLWNGLRGGLIVPAADMQVSGLSGAALLSTWKARGADTHAIQTGSVYAYELAGYYAFASQGEDSAVSMQLRRRVASIVEDAPALANVVDPNAAVTVTNVSGQYRVAGTGDAATSLTPLVMAGKGLTRVPVVQLRFGQGDGTLVLSQLLTAGRLLPDHTQSGPGVYGLRYDPVAVQFVLNMLAASLDDPKQMK